MEALFQSLPEVLARAGARPERVTLPAAFSGLVEAQHVIWTFEIARCLADEHRRNAESIGERLRTMLDDGATMPVTVYDESVALVRACQAELPAVFCELDALVVPSAPGETPEIASTGDPVFNRAWSALGTPVVNVPAGTGKAGLPLGVQVVGRPGRRRTHRRLRRMGGGRPQRHLEASLSVLSW